MLQTISARDWNTAFPDSTKNPAITGLENGQILHLPELAFSLSPQEAVFLSPHYADPHSKNIGFQPQTHRLWGMQNLNEEEFSQLRAMMERYSRYAHQLVQALLPSYIPHLMMGRTSFRPVQICDRKTSFRKDDKRLHVDAFPSAPNQGKRILRVFCNINPDGEDRVWRTGETFEQVANQFLSKIPKPLPGKASLLRMFKITKSYRTLYDHYMLEMHDRMKADEQYQQKADQRELRFAPGSTWIVQTDHVSHAAMKGQHMLEQTFYLPIEGMQDPALSPLKVLERMMGKELV